MKKLINRIKRWFRHDWEHHQELLLTGYACDPRADTVLAWKQCRRCAKSKLIHILK